MCDSIEEWWVSFHISNEFWLDQLIESLMWQCQRNKRVGKLVTKKKPKKNWANYDEKFIGHEQRRFYRLQRPSVVCASLLLADSLLHVLFLTILCVILQFFLFEVYLCMFVCMNAEKNAFKIYDMKFHYLYNKLHFLYLNQKRKKECYLWPNRHLHATMRMHSIKNLIYL